MLGYLTKRYAEALDNVNFFETETLFAITPRMAQIAIRENAISNVSFHKVVRALLIETMTGHFEKVAHRPEIEGWKSLEDDRAFFTRVYGLIEWH